MSDVSKRAAAQDRHDVWSATRLQPACQGQPGQAIPQHGRPLEIARQPLIQVQNRDAQPIFRLLPKAFAQGNAEHQNKHEGHYQQNHQGPGIAHEKAEIFPCQDPNNH